MKKDDPFEVTQSDVKRENRVAFSEVPKKNVAIALSGGVDSLVAASLLKQEYPDLFGIHFTTGYEAVAEDNVMDIIQNLQSQLNIPIYRIDLKDIFEKKVVSYFLETYQRGSTPNPCIVCNKKIKFGVLYDAARNLGADLLATGHYARTDTAKKNIARNSIDTVFIDNIEKKSINTVSPEHIANNSIDKRSWPDSAPPDHEKQIYFQGKVLIDKQSRYVVQEPVMLLKGKDRLKDQSYFLSMLSCEQLRYALFPLGNLTKQETVAIAAKRGLVPVHKKESQDICFIHENSFVDFISSKCDIPFTPGDIVTTDNKVVGIHKGLHCYTIGQRRGLNCPGPAPYYVKTIDMEHNRLIVSFKEELFEKECYVKNINWLCDFNTLSTSSLKITTRIRYSHSGALSTVIPADNTDTLYNAINVKVIFDEPQLAVTPGQCAVFYDQEQVIGAGFIE
ncbi:MAG: tRNA 2-thiouridine(34) synthase MnmA [Desulfamplus sp.]|nr:tRNA 2-thiouridine(34) synthase MnmA [Desulfamplus sp.]